MVARKRPEVESEPHLLHLLSSADVHDSSLFGQRPWGRIFVANTDLFLRDIVSDSGQSFLVSPQGSTAGYCNLFRLDAFAKSDLVQGGGHINTSSAFQLGPITRGAGGILDVG